MPKRIPTPPPADDEPRYLSVVHPYAISGTCNMELPKDRQDFARWVACCVDKDAFFAIFHKPSSRGMVIIEVSRSYPHFDRILGEHRWREFLRNPTDEESGRATQVFYCTYSTGRIVQKNGWKRIDVDEAWFKAWSPRNKQISFPYPQTHFCDLPVEDRTNHPLCRPLPGAVITPPVEIAAPQPVVGSTAWIQEKTGGHPLIPNATENKPKTLGAWGKGAPKAHAAPPKPNPTANGSVKKTGGISQGPSVATKTPATGGGSIAVKSSNVWKNTSTKPTAIPVAANWEELPHVSRQGTPVSPSVLSAAIDSPPAAPAGLPAQKGAWGNGTGAYPALPPGLAVPTKYATSVAQDTPDRAAHSSVTSWGPNGASASSPDSESGPDPTTATESDNPYAIHINFSESMEKEFHGMGIHAMEDEGELREIDSIAPNWDGHAVAAAWETDAQGWVNDPLDAEDLWRHNQEAPKPALCAAHGIICKKGICAEYAKQLRLSKRAEERAATATRGKKNGRARGRGAGKSGENEPSGKKTTVNSAFRGPGAPVKTNWRGAPRAIVSADAIEKREAAKAVSDDGFSDPEIEPNVAAAVSPPDAVSDASWNAPQGFDPWATTEQPVVKANNRPASKPQGKKKPGKPAAAGLSSWADRVDAEIAWGGDTATSPAVSSKHGPKRGGSTASWGTSNTKSSVSRGTNDAKSSTSGWGTVADMPF